MHHFTIAIHRNRTIAFVIWIACIVGCGKPAASPATSTNDQAQAAVDSAIEEADASPPKPPADSRPIAVSAHGFVSSGSCRDCHPKQHDTWHASYHRRMTQIASTESVIGNFDDVTVQAYGREFKLSKRDGEFWVAMHDLATDVGPNSELIERQIALTTGSHHMQIYWYSFGEQRTLAQLPVAWLKETQSWVPTSSLFISPPPQPLHVGKLRWNETCIKCHTTHGQPRIDEVKSIVDTQVAEFGISCEACHGPGETHVANQTASADETSADEFLGGIVHPEKLAHRQASQICGQCHGNWLPKDDAELTKYIWDGNSFRAGDELADSGHIFGCGMARNQFIEGFLQQRPHYFEDRFWSDGMIRVSGGEYNGLANSTCFQRGTMSCLSCHEMHPETTDANTLEQWTTDQLKPNLKGSDACLQCHEQFRDEAKLTSHTFHSATSSGSDCYNCHMPHTTYGLLKAMRSHQISVPNASDTVQVGRPNACNQCHADKTLAWTADYLNEWYGIAKPELTRDQRQISSTALLCLTGDAGQRALAAWSLGWKPAQEASGTDWMVPILAQMLADPYDAVRHVAHRSLRTLPGFESFEYEFTGSAEKRRDAAIRAFGIWGKRTVSPRTSNAPAVLLTREGQLMGEEFTRLNRLRDNRQVLLAE